ncbi:MAG TPA: cyclopropane-fatty-acyl-phospholipid synthase family protein [Alphaproteobacteria bacterium]|nr:cyclopropane-fatty-acyl-phospholipid synthase family protein [Alphaproteobacteria bacterium]
MSPFAKLMNHFIRAGTLTVIDAAGRRHVFGGKAPGPAATIRLHEKRLEHRILVNPHLGVGEAYMDGTLTIEEGTLYDFLDLCGLNLDHLESYRLQAVARWLRTLFRGWHQNNPVGVAKSNVAHHYDLSGALYDLFLDKDRQYSCAYFTTGNDTLEVAQDNKKRHIAAKLLLKPGLKVLDIGSGWGGLGLYLAKVAPVDVTGVTLSEEQHKMSEQRARDAGLADRVRFRLQDYRHVDQRFDRIVSVGMFEHVGARHYPEFFGKVRELLADDGVCLLHSIGRMEPPGSTNAWLRKYIFPGGYTPALSEVLTVVERIGLWVTDIEILRLHYAETLHEWNRRFQDNRDKVARLYDERFCRMWEFYLQGCEMAFRRMRQMVFQMQLAKHPDSAPLTRDYITDWEREHAARGNLAA